MDEIIYVLDGTGYVTVLIHVTESYEKVLLDRNTLYSSIAHRIYGY